MAGRAGAPTVSAKTSQQAAISKTAVDRAQTANEEKKDRPSKLKNYGKTLLKVF